MLQYKNKVLIILMGLILPIVITPPDLFCSDQNDLFTTEAELRYFMLYKHRSTALPQIFPADKNISGKKIPAVGILLSAAVPGAGEFYAGSIIKGVAFMGVEILLWWKYFDFRGKGFDLEDKYETFADDHWDRDRWESEYNPDTDPSTHTLPETKTQQYYEMIGKYDQFQAGWDNQENRDRYMTMRLDSNNEFEKASTCAMLTLANHIFSSLDAAWTIRTVNRKIDSKMEMSYKNVHGNPVPFLSLTASW